MGKCGGMEPASKVRTNTHLGASEEDEVERLYHYCSKGHVIIVRQQLAQRAQHALRTQLLAQLLHDDGAAALQQLSTRRAPEAAQDRRQDRRVPLAVRGHQSLAGKRGRDAHSQSVSAQGRSGQLPLGALSPCTGVRHGPGIQHASLSTRMSHQQRCRFLHDDL